MKIAFVTNLFIFVFAVCTAQNTLDEFSTKNQWSDGRIVTNDGTELKGRVKFDDLRGVVNYKNGDDSRSLTPKRIAAFDFFDEDVQKQRFFYSIEYLDPLTSSSEPQFFEVLKDFKTFAVMSRVDRARLEQKGGGGPITSPAPDGGTLTHGYSQPNTVALQTETIFFLSEDGSFDPYIEATINLYRDRRRNKFVDSEAIERYFSTEELETLRKFAKGRDLDFKVKDELIKILDFAATFVNK